ncbi:MAG: PEP-CTERM sorting domain-containing protein [Phycisphaerales bacterium]
MTDRHRPSRFGPCLLVLGAWALSTNATADVIQYDGLEAWQAATGPTSTITFAEFGQPIFPITDEYAHLGVSFEPTQVPQARPGSFLDGWGVSTTVASNWLSVYFDEEITEFAFIAPSTTVLRLLRDSEVIHYVALPGNEVHGFVSDIAFDEIRISNGTGLNAVDDIHFTTIPAPATPLLLMAAGMAGARRRRR